MQGSDRMPERDFKIADWLGQKAEEALLEELYATPKPGLVDRYSNGAHKDMDLPLFEKSAGALKPFFSQMAELGYLCDKHPSGMFPELRKLGIEAENAMRKATGDINTHKGSIFSLGILCAAAGYCYHWNGYAAMHNLIRTEQEMVRKTLAEELSTLGEKEKKSHGEMLYKKYGIQGARGEALNGYPSACKTGLPVLLEGIRKRQDWNRIKLQVLLSLMAQVDDTNVLFRTDEKTLEEAKQAAEHFLNEGGAYRKDGLQKLELMDEEFTRKNISHGGCADLLAVTLFLYSILSV